ncbi:hypothetical protein MRX96_018346 [Rhipicephalus microplus]
MRCFQEISLGRYREHVRALTHKRHRPLRGSTCFERGVAYGRALRNSRPPCPTVPEHPRREERENTRGFQGESLWCAVSGGGEQCDERSQPGQLRDAESCPSSWPTSAAAQRRSVLWEAEPVASR